MASPPDEGDESGEDSATLNVEVENERTNIRVSGDRDTAVVVRSESGETIYLPPEDFDRSAESTQTAYDGPYQSGSGAQDSPYETRPDVSSVTGQEPTADGYIINHPEPITDLRFLR